MKEQIQTSPDDSRRASSHRAVSPVVGIVLLVAVALLLAAGAAGAILTLTDDTPAQPSAVLVLEEPDQGVEYTLRHEDGSPIQGNRTRILGVADANTLDGQTIVAGDTAGVIPVEPEVRVTWRKQDTSYTLTTFEVAPEDLVYDARAIANGCQWAEDNIRANGDFGMSSDTAVCQVTEETQTGITDINADLDNSVLVGDLTTDGDADLDNGTVVGDVRSSGSDIVLTTSSTVYGDVIAEGSTNVDIDGGSYVTGHIYIGSGSFSCSSATIGPNNASCSEYSPRSLSDL